ncbi:DUF1206 domain-containing protein [Amycolatopsis sacchari]|uniref:DUF1206 domain-containing protein n=1 Tax=Amycolatopsis sacchari TaxID=115433 RepID=A0A1I3K6T6_9PSEU|nr:DUF1206 domain-containing protein [Amycolatopsis sacchari]SFI68146.1 protein of unknown function [Amycolatopsis sacchari]
MTGGPVARRASRVESSRTAQVAGRLGMACWGLVHLVVAYLAVRVAFGDSGHEADQKGALQEIGGTAFGQVLLWVLAVGLIAFGLWQGMLAATGYGWVREHGKRVRKRIGSGARGVVVFGLAYTAIRLATGSGSGSGDQAQQEFTAKLLSLPAGPVLVAVAAAVVVGVGIAAAVKGVKRSFLRDLDTSELPTGSRHAVEWLGAAGYVAKGLVYVIIGALLGYAALRSDARQAGGLDKALRTLAAQPYGVVLLVIVALGLAAFGVYCFAAARAHRS